MAVRLVGRLEACHSTSGKRISIQGKISRCQVTTQTFANDRWRWAGHHDSTLGRCWIQRRYDRSLRRASSVAPSTATTPCHATTSTTTVLVINRLLEFSTCRGRMISVFGRKTLCGPCPKVEARLTKPYFSYLCRFGSTSENRYTSSSPTHEPSLKTPKPKRKISQPPIIFLIHLPI